MDELELLQKTQEVLRAEQKLTELLRKVEPWLSLESQKSSNSKLKFYSERVRPIPTSMEQVDVILAMARNWSSKTSAPAGWDPQLAPVMGFATPNPLPHQLRGGALAALQLELATTQKYRTQQQKREEEAKVSKRSQQENTGASNDGKGGGSQDNNNGVEDSSNPKKRKAMVADSAVVRQQRANPQRTPSIEVTMNLSDSSSEEEDDEDE